MKPKHKLFLLVPFKAARLKVTCENLPGVKNLGTSSGLSHIPRTSLQAAHPLASTSPPRRGLPPLREDNHPAVSALLRLDATISEYNEPL